MVQDDFKKKLKDTISTNFSDNKWNMEVMNRFYLKKEKPVLFDKFYTKIEVTNYLVKKTIGEIRLYLPSIKHLVFVEPSAGSGNFIKSLRNEKIPNSKIKAYDLEPDNREVVKSNFFDVNLPKKNFVVIGNPPFGHRGNLALKFINHSKDADFIAFILPMTFEGIGKGSGRTRVKTHNLIYSEILKPNIFSLESGEDYKVQCVFQIWSKNFSLPFEKEWNTDKYLDIYTICTNKNRLCGLKMIGKCDFYISSTFFKDVKITKSWDKVKYGSGIGVVIKKKQEGNIKIIWKRKLIKQFKFSN